MHYCRLVCVGIFFLPRHFLSFTEVLLSNNASVKEVQPTECVQLSSKTEKEVESVGVMYVQAAGHMVSPGPLHTGPLPIPLPLWWHAPPVSPADPTPLFPTAAGPSEGLAATAAHCRRLVIPALRAAIQ